MKCTNVCNENEWDVNESQIGSSKYGKEVQCTLLKFVKPSGPCLIK